MRARRQGRSEAAAAGKRTPCPAAAPLPVDSGGPRTSELLHYGAMDPHADADRVLGPCNDPACPAGAGPGPEWITYRQAAEILGVTHTTIGAMVKDGRIGHRKLAASYYPSINARSVRAHVAEREADRRVREQRRREQEDRRRPPDDGEVWLSASVAAAVLGISRSRLWQRTRAGRTPCTWKDGRMWFRRSDIETRAAVVAFHRRPR